LPFYFIHIMDIIKEDIDQLNAVLKVKVGPQDYQEKVNKALGEYRKKAKIPGFRPGMAPMGMVKKMVGVSALVEEVNKLLSDNLGHWIKDNELNILGQPLPKPSENAINWETQTEFEFLFELGLEPKFDTPKLENITIETLTVSVNDALINKSVEDACKRFGKVINSETAEENDILYGHFDVCDENGNSLEDGHYHSTILINTVPNNETKTKLIGLKPQDEILLEAQKTWKDKEDIKARFHIDDEKVEKIKTLKFRLEKINRIEPAQVNQELFEKIYGPGIVNSEEEFKKKIKQELEKNIALDSDFKLRKDLREKLLSQINFSLPDEFLKRWILASNEKPISIQQLEKEYDSYAKMLRWQLVENRFIKENNIEVKWEEVVEQTKQLISMQYLKMGLPLPDDQELQGTVSKILQNNDEAKRIFDNLYDTKLFNLYKSKITVQPKEIEYDEFVKLLQE